MVCFDMDGVLVKYDRDAYKGDNPAYLQPGYFRECEPDEFAIRLIRYCMLMLPRDTFINTGVRKDLRNQMVLDKLFWVTVHIPEFDIGTRFIANSDTDKSALFEHLRMTGLTKNDILIDDYNPRLYNWKMRGGTAIKYLNGINSEHSWDGTCIDGTKDFVPAQDIFMEMMRATL